MDESLNSISQCKKKLDEISPAFCIVRWKHATLNLASGASKSCCHHDFKNISLDQNFTHLHDNSEEQKLRSQMLAGQRTKDCSYCWWVEDNGHYSDRQNWAAKPWMAPSLGELSHRLSNEAEVPSWLELNFSSVCNLKCVYCSPIFSTKWHKEIKKFGPYPTTIPHNNIDNLNHIEFEDHYENTELLNKFWPWFHQIVPQLKLLKITGGEPLLSEQTFQLLKIIEQNKAPTLGIGINSNLSLSEPVWNRFLAQIVRLEETNAIDNVYLHPSLDCFGSRAEYIRTGLDTKALIKNVKGFLQKSRGSVVFICTLNNLALGGLMDYWRFVLELKQKYFREDREISIGTEILKYPPWLNINILPEYYVEYLDDVIAFAETYKSTDSRGFQEYEIEGLKKARSSFSSKPENMRTSRGDFAKFIQAIDERRGLDFKNTFPELTDFYKLCRRESFQALNLAGRLF